VRGQGRNGWRQCCNIEGCVTTFTPGSEPSFSDAFFALLLRAGVSESIENEIARTDYAVYDSADTMERIDEVSRRLPNDVAGIKASVNRLQGQEMDPATVAAALSSIPLAHQSTPPPCD
jgi:hypothetical protein